MRFEIIEKTPIINYNDEFCDFLAKNSESFYLAGRIEDVDHSKKRDDFESKYKNLLPYLIKVEKSKHYVDYYFHVAPVTVLWLKSQSNILCMPMPLEYIGFCKGSKSWCAVESYHVVFGLEIEDEETQKEFQKLLDKPSNLICNFINHFTRMKNSMEEEAFIKEMRDSSFENKFFLQQFDQKFYDKRWNNEIKEFYSNDENLRLFAKILVSRGEKCLTDDDLFLMSYWLRGMCTSLWFKRIKDYQAFSGSEYVYDFLSSIDSKRFAALFFRVFKIKNENLQLKYLVEIFEKLGCEEEIKDIELLQAYRDIASAFKEWSGQDPCKIWSIKYRIECNLQLHSVNTYFKKMFRSECILINSIDSIFPNSKGARYIREDNLLEQKYTAYRYLNIGSLVYKNSASKAIFWLDRLANLRDLDCQIDIGKCYLNGVGVKKDSEKAKYWLNKAVEQGSLAAKDLIAKTQV